VESESALVWAAGVVVLDAVSLEELVVPVVHFDGEVNHDLVLGLSEDDPGAMLEVEQLGRVKHRVDGLEIEVVWIVWKTEFCGDRPTGQFGRGCCCSHAWHPFQYTRSEPVSITRSTPLPIRPHSGRGSHPVGCYGRMVDFPIKPNERE